jgi:hypothetical protein
MGAAGVHLGARNVWDCSISARWPPGFLGPVQLWRRARGAVRGGILIHLMPVFSSVFAAVFIGERLFPYHAAGFVFVAGGAILGCLRSEPVILSQASTKI